MNNNNNKHMDLSMRTVIEKSLGEGLSFKAMGRMLEKDCSTIAKEIKNHMLFQKKGSYGRAFNDCAIRMDCTVSHCCAEPSCRNRFCRFCGQCHKHCAEYQKESCSRLSKPPYVCNACENRTKCTLEKRLYSAHYASKEYTQTLSESRKGVQISEDEARRINAVVSPLIQKGQSPHAICLNHRDELMCDERTIYNYIDLGILSVRNIDLPRKVRYSKRKKKGGSFKVDKQCRMGRDYQAYLQFLEDNPDTPITQMDSVEGRKGGKVLLTIHLTKPELMIAFLREANTSQSVTDSLERLYRELTPDTFVKLFPLFLGDNGSEFSNPTAIEYDQQGNLRTKVFYCDPSSPHQKGAAENNHEFIRRIIPKGNSIDSFTQEDINLMMNHINNYPRKSLGDRTPCQMFEILYGEDVLKKLGASHVSPDEVTLHPSLLQK